jgi:hypothetical protein
MKKLLFLFLLVLCNGCFRHQHEERIANGDTATATDTQSAHQLQYSVPHSKPKENLLFEQKCRSCHYQIGSNLSCQTMSNVLDRIPGGAWKYNWFRNPDSMVAAGDAYSVRLKLEWNNQPHPAFPELSSEEIDHLLQYISEW